MLPGKVGLNADAQIWLAIEVCIEDVVDSVTSHIPSLYVMCPYEPQGSVLLRHRWCVFVVYKMDISFERAGSLPSVAAMMQVNRRLVINTFDKIVSHYESLYLYLRNYSLVTRIRRLILSGD